MYIPFGDKPATLKINYTYAAKELLTNRGSLRTEINKHKDLIATKPASTSTVDDIKAICVSIYAKNELDRLDNFKINSFQPYVISFYKKDGSYLKSPSADDILVFKESISLQETTQAVLGFFNLFGLKSQYNLSTDLKKKVNIDEYDCETYEEILAVLKIILQAIFDVTSRGRALGMNRNITQLLPTDEEISIC